MIIFVGDFPFKLADDLLEIGEPNRKNCFGSLVIQIVANKPDHFLGPSGTSLYEGNNPYIVISDLKLLDIRRMVGVVLWQKANVPVSKLFE